LNVEAKHESASSSFGFKRSVLLVGASNMVCTGSTCTASPRPVRQLVQSVDRSTHGGQHVRQDVAPQVKFESKITANSKAAYCYLASSAEFQALSTWG
jgi:hypothetical protein